MKNYVSIIGRLGKEPEVKDIGGAMLCKLSVATSSSKKTKSGEWSEETQWHQISVWGKEAEKIAEKNLPKGSQIGVDGSIHYNQGKDTKFYPEIKARKVYFV